MHGFRGSANGPHQKLNYCGEVSIRVFSRLTRGRGDVTCAALEIFLAESVWPALRDQNPGR